MTTPHDNEDNAPQDNSPQDNSSRDNSSREGVHTADLSDSSVVPLSDSADDAELLADAHPDELEGGSIDRMLADAGQRLRQPATALDGAAIWAAAGTANPKAEATVADVVDIQAARRSVRRMKWLTSAAAVVAVVSLGASAAIATRNSSDDEAQLTSAADTSASGEDGSGADPTATDAQFVASPAALALVRKLPAAPVDPTTEKLAAAVESFASCDALLGNLRQVGAEHVGSRGFNGTNFGPLATNDMALERAAPAASPSAVAGQSAATGSYASSGETIGTNIQVAGVDEPDSTKAIGTTVYDLRNNRLRIIDTTKGEVIGRIDLDSGDQKLRSADASTLLVSGPTVVVFGSESEQSEPVPGDPSASVSSHQYVTVTMIDITDPTKPTQTDRVRIDGGLVSARLVDGEVRMVTGSFLANIGFVMPTSPESIPKALNINRLSVADSTIDMWIPSYSRDGGDPAPLIPCDRVHVPETFAGVSMTSMVSFPEPVRHRRQGDHRIHDLGRPGGCTDAGVPVLGFSHPPIRVCNRRPVVHRIGGRRRVDQQPVLLRRDRRSTGRRLDGGNPLAVRRRRESGSHDLRSIGRSHQDQRTCRYRIGRLGLWRAVHKDQGRRVDLQTRARWFRDQHEHVADR